MYICKKGGEKNLFLNDPIFEYWILFLFFFGHLAVTKLSCISLVLLLSMSHIPHQPCNFPECIKQLYFQGGVSRSENTQGAMILLTYKCFLWVSKEK